MTGLDRVICCFCGRDLPESGAVLLAMYATADRVECQALYCHRRCIDERLRPEVPRLLDEDEEGEPGPPAP